MKNKKAIIVLSALLVAVIAIGTSVAYQTSSTNGVNVMTFGEVEIAQHEYERATDEKGKWYSLTDKDGNVVVDEYGYKPDKLQPFTQNKTIAPAFYVDGNVKWDDRNGSQKSSGEGSHQQSWAEVGAPGSNQLFDSSVKNVIDKFVFVENTGDNDAYYRTIIAIEMPEGFNDEYLHTSLNGNSRFDYNNDVEGSQNHENSNKFYATIEGVRYLVYTATYTEVLKPGEVSRPSLLQVYLDPKATNEDVELFNGSLDILVFSQATQVFDEVSADRALTAAFGEVETNLPWTDATFTKPLLDENTNTLELSQNLILRNEPLYSSNTATEAVTINGNGHTITQTATNVDAFDWKGNTPLTSNMFSSSNGEKVTVNDLSFAGTMQSIMLGHYVNAKYNNFYTELNNVNVIGLNVVSFSAGISPAVTVYGTAVINNSNIYDTKLSALDTDPMWPVYDLAVVNYSTTNINGGKVGSIYMWENANLKVSGKAQIGSILVTKANTGAFSNFGITIESGVTVDLLDLTKVAATDKNDVVVEEGATIKKVVVDGTEMTYKEWLNS